MIKKYFIIITFLLISCGKDLNKKNLVIVSSPLISNHHKDAINETIHIIEEIKICSQGKETFQMPYSMDDFTDWIDEKIKKYNSTFEILEAMKIDAPYSDEIEFVINSLDNRNEQLTAININKLEASINKIKDYKNLSNLSLKSKAPCISQIIKRKENKSIFSYLRKIIKQEEYIKRGIEEKNFFASISNKQSNSVSNLEISINKKNTMSSSKYEKHYNEINSLQELKRKIISLNIREEYKMHMRVVDNQISKLKKLFYLIFLSKEEKLKISPLRLLNYLTRSNTSLFLIQLSLYDEFRFVYNLNETEDLAMEKEGIYRGRPVISSQLKDSKYTINASVHIIEIIRKLCSVEKEIFPKFLSTNELTNWIDEKIKKYNEAITILKATQPEFHYSANIDVVINSLDDRNEHLTEVSINKLKSSINKIKKYQFLINLSFENKKLCIPQVIKDNESIFSNLKKIIKQEKYIIRTIEENNFFRKISREQRMLVLRLTLSLKKISTTSYTLTKENKNYYNDLNSLQKLKRKIISLNIREEYKEYIEEIDNNISNIKRWIPFLFRSKEKKSTFPLFANIEKSETILYHMQLNLNDEFFSSFYDLNLTETISHEE